MDKNKYNMGRYDSPMRQMPEMPDMNDKKDMPDMREMPYSYPGMPDMREMPYSYPGMPDRPGKYYPCMPDMKEPNMKEPTKSPEDNDEKDEMDMEYMKKLYPEICKMIQHYVDQECDNMEYDGSAMYDEYPDKETMEMICEKIYQKLIEDGVMEPEEVEEEEIDTMQRGYGGGYGRGYGRGHRRGRRRRYYGRPLVRTIYLNEMYNRRRRCRRCRRCPYPGYGYGSCYPYYQDYYYPYTY